MEVTYYQYIYIQTPKVMTGMDGPKKNITIKHQTLGGMTACPGYTPLEK